MLREIAKKAKGINIRQLALLVAQTNSELIADSLREQLSKGQAGDNSAVGIYSSLYYANRKSKISKAPFGVVDLKLIGDLHNEIFVKFSPSKVETGSSVDYSKYQVKRYGKRIYEVNSKNSEEIKNKNSKRIVEEYSKALGI